MSQFFLQRLATLIATLAVASLVVFGVLEVLPGNAAQTLLGPDADPEAVAALAAQLGLDQPAWQRYLQWVHGLLTGALGDSHAYGSPVAELILGNASVILERSRRIVRQNLAVLEKWVESEPHLSFVKPEAGTTALVYYDYDIDSRTFCIDMIKKSGALVTPGDCFEEPKSMRIGYAYSDNTDDLQKGLDAISAYMRTLE